MIIMAKIESERPTYRYCVDAHFIDGSKKRLIITSKRTPAVDACKGTYWLDTDKGRILGVVSCEVLSKKEVKQ